MLVVHRPSDRVRLDALPLMAGLLVAYALSFVVDLFGVILGPRIRGPDVPAFNNLLQGIKVFLGLITCYVGVSLVLQTKDDFRFVIPYIEFTKQVRGQRPVLLDTSVIIDGRILDVAQARFLTSRLIVPRFVLNELQQVADSADMLRRALDTANFPSMLAYLPAAAWRSISLRRERSFDVVNTHFVVPTGPVGQVIAEKRVQYKERPALKIEFNNNAGGAKAARRRSPRPAPPTAVCRRCSSSTAPSRTSASSNSR